MAYIDPKQRGYCLLYHEGANMHCPGCGHSNWHVGRNMAECAFCATALPMADVGAREAYAVPKPGFVPAGLPSSGGWQPAGIHLSR
jgi:hypothetical protein